MSNEYLVACELNPRDHSVIIAANVKHNERPTRSADGKFRFRSSQLLELAVSTTGWQALSRFSAPHPVRILRTQLSSCLEFPEAVGTVRPREGGRSARQFDGIVSWGWCWQPSTFVQS